MLNASLFSQLCLSEEMNAFELGSSLAKLLNHEQEGQYAPIEDKELSTAIITLHENGYLTDASAILIRPLYDKLTPRQCHAITGLLFGEALENGRIVRSSMLDLLKHDDIRADVLEGVISVLIRDIEA